MLQWNGSYWIAAAGLLLLPLLGRPALAQEAAEAPAASGAAVVYVCLIEGMIDDGIGVVVKRAVREAEEAGAKAIIFEIDTPGGRVDSAIDITNVIMDATVPTVAYIRGMGAISAGAMISYACDTIVMAPATNIGASTPVTMGGPEPSEAMNEKSMSFVRARYRAMGEANGHDPLLGEAMVDPKIEVRGVKGADGAYQFMRVEDGVVVEGDAASGPGAADEVIDSVFEDFQEQVGAPLDDVKSTLKKALQEAGEQSQLPEEAPPAQERENLPDGSVMVSRAGELLTLTTNEAEEYGLSTATAASLDEVLEIIGLPEAGIHRVEVTMSEALFRWLTSPLISSLLLMLGFGGLYVEIRTPGFGLPGVVGLVCLALFFGSYAVIGLADWVDLILVLAGILLILVEIFLLPGFGIPGVLGALCLFAGLYLSMVRVPVPQFEWQFDRLRDAGQTVTLATVMFAVLAVLTWKLFPKTPMYNWLVLSEAQQAEDGYKVQTDLEMLNAIGLRGLSTSVLRPAGRGRFHDRNYDVMTRGEFIAADRPIQIIQAEGNRYVVVELKDNEV